MKNKLLVFAFVGSLTTVSAYGQDFTISGVHYNITSVDGATEKTVEITRTEAGISSCYDGDLVLSSTITDSSIDYTITSIANSTFFECQTLISITLPNSITSIGSGVFNGCNKLTNVALPNSITSIRQETFRNCAALTSITLPNSITSIGVSSFRDTGLTSITLPNSIMIIGLGAFINCTALTTVSINKAIPLTITPNVFMGVELVDLTLKVPTGSVSAYQGADVWEDFGTIEEIEEEIVDEPNLNTESHVKENAFSIAIHNGFLEITQADKALKINKVQIINLLGQVVKTSKENSIALSNLSAGVYIVSIYTKNGRFSRKFVRE